MTKQQRTFQDFQVGQTWTTPAKRLTGDLVEAFITSTGDDNPLHRDGPFARASLFGRPVVHGLLVLGTTVGLWMRTGAFDGVAFSGIDKVRFLKPVFFDEAVHAKLTIASTEDRGDYGLVVVHNDVVNDKGETVLVFDARLALPHRKA